MQHVNSEAERDLEQLSQALGLTYEPQDWGIINADSQRLDEFVTYYEANPLSATQRCELGELILASANDRLLRNESLTDALLPFLLRNGLQFETQLEYWQSLPDDVEFPFGNWLRDNFREPLDDCRTAGT